MRSDMHKAVGERERHGSTRKSPRRAQSDRTRHIRSFGRDDRNRVFDRRRSQGVRVSNAGEVVGFYVHPRTKLLCFALRPSARERKKRRLMQQEIDELRIDDTRSFKLIDDDQWYFVTYEIVEIGRYQRPHKAWDVVQGRHVQVTWGRSRVAVSKRQCNRAEVKSIHQRIA
jgi:hypothetical protein